MQLETDIGTIRLVWIADKQEDSASFSPTLLCVKNMQYRGKAFCSPELGSDLFKVTQLVSDTGGDVTQILDSSLKFFLLSIR